MTTPSPWQIRHVELTVELDEPVLVHSVLHVERTPGTDDVHLTLDGRGLELRSVAIDGCRLDPDDYRLEPRALHLHLGDADRYTVACTVTPTVGGDNDKGVTRRPTLVSTNCEPEGFRRITWFVDRPDVRATYDVTLVGDPHRFRTMLANGHLVEQGTRADGRAWARFTDPVSKPSYLFAFVAGDLDVRSVPFTTRSGRTVHLQVAADPDSIAGAGFALSLMALVMQLDERAGSPEHDLDALVFVAVPGYPDATEYHGLMFFDPSLLLLDPRGATDDDALLISANIAHEYGHHVRGNRVTVRSWDQLALKEGLTVLFQNDVRAHQFGGVGRVMDVLDLRRLQFPEEVTLAAPVVQPPGGDPERLYTRTTYLKGAEVFGMLRTTLGPEVWAAVMATFVERFDLGAATVADLLAVAREVAPDHSTTVDAIARWFTLVGRPALAIDTSHTGEPDADTVVVHLRRTDALADDPPVAVPVRLAVVAADGAVGPEQLHVLTGRSATVRVARPPGAGTGSGSAVMAVSALRGYSAPVDASVDLTGEQLAVLLLHDPDPVSRWLAAERLLVRVIDAHRAGQAAAAADDLGRYVHAVSELLRSGIDRAMLAQLLVPPDEFMLGDREPTVDVDGVAAGLTYVRAEVGRALHDPLLAHLQALDDRPGGTAPADIAARWLLDAGLGVLLASGSDEAVAFATAQLASADHTRVLRSLGQLAHLDAVPIDDLLADVRHRWDGAPRLVERWMRVQSASRRSDTIERVGRLVAGADYVRTDRGRVMGAWFPFCTRNRSVFHHPSGAGYRLFADELGPLLEVNAGLVLRLVGDLLQFRRFDPHRQQLMRAELERLTDAPGLPDFAVGILRNLLTN